MKVLFFVLTAVLSFNVWAGDADYKVIGRGFYNPETHQVLQLACVGEDLSPESNERKCNRLQFLLTESDRTQALLGPIFVVEDESTSKIVHQLKAQFEISGMSQDLTRQRKWSMTRFTFGRGSQKTSQDIQMLAFIGMGIGSAKLMLALETVIPPLGFFLLGSTMLGTFPIWFDLAALPITALWDAIEGNGAIGVRAKSIAALQDNAKYSWQFKPKKIDAKRFDHLVQQLLSGCDPTKKVFHRKQLVAIPGSYDGHAFELKYGILKQEIMPDVWYVKPYSGKDRRKFRKMGLMPIFNEKQLNAYAPKCETATGAL